MSAHQRIYTAARGLASWRKTDVDTASENLGFVPTPGESAALVSTTRRECVGNCS